MKRISLLMALLVCLTVSGVYAAWTYAGTDDIADVYAETKITIADVTLQGANGTYKIESNLVLLVDQANEDHEAELDFNSNNNEAVYLKVTFTPADNASTQIKDHALNTEVYFGTTTTMQYDGRDILTFSNPGNGELDNLITWTKENNGTFTFTMDETALKAAISLNGTFVLDTKAKHDAFRTALTGNVVVRVTDGIVTGTTSET